ncbi:MAG: hypothetical protein FWD18_00490 [Micrococcales bacterium]|nr:hypothetical protein [Micrococcales bacterium]
MASWRNPLDGPDGTTVTAANGGGQAWSSVTGGTMVYTTSRAFRGPGCATATSETIGYLIRNLSGSASPRADMVAYVWLSTTPLASTQDVPVLRTYTSAGIAAALVLRGMSSNNPKIVLSTRGSGSNVDRWTSTPNIPRGTWVRVELNTEAGTSPTTGAARARMYAGDDTTPIADSGLVTGVDTAGSSGIVQDARAGMSSGVWVDHIGIRDGADATGSPWPSAVAPTVALPGLTVVAPGAPWSTVATVGTDGSIASTAWTVTRVSADGVTDVTSQTTGQGTLTLGSTAPTVGGVRLDVSVVVTDGDGLTGTATTTVHVPTGANLRPLAVDGQGDPWSILGGAATQGQALGDGSTQTGVRSPDVPAGASSTRRWPLQPATPRDALDITVGGLSTSAGDLTVTAQLWAPRGVLVATKSGQASGSTLSLSVPDAATTIGTDPTAWADMWVAVTAVA